MYCPPGSSAADGTLVLMSLVSRDNELASELFHLRNKGQTKDGGGVFFTRWQSQTRVKSRNSSLWCLLSLDGSLSSFLLRSNTTSRGRRDHFRFPLGRPMSFQNTGGLGGTWPNEEHGGVLRWWFGVKQPGLLLSAQRQERGAFLSLFHSDPRRRWWFPGAVTAG